METKTEIFSVPLMHINETESTNTYLQDLCARQPMAEMTTLLADYQTCGRGQRGNSWESAPRANLLFSFVLFPDFLEARQQFLLSQLTSLAIKEELDTHGEGFSIKWPNDLYWRDKKIGGILIENDWSGTHICRSIVGIGLNINQEKFQSPAPNPVSLRQITGKEFPRVELLDNLMHRIRNYYQQVKLSPTTEAARIERRYAKALFRKEGFHRYKDDNGCFNARIVQVETEGRLILEDEAQEQRSYWFKEVEYVL